MGSGTATYAKMIGIAAVAALLLGTAAVRYEQTTETCAAAPPAPVLRIFV